MKFFQVAKIFVMEKMEMEMHCLALAGIDVVVSPLKAAARPALLACGRAPSATIKQRLPKVQHLTGNRGKIARVRSLWYQL